MNYSTQAHILFETVLVFIYLLTVYLYETALCSEHVKQ